MQAAGRGGAPLRLPWLALTNTKLEGEMEEGMMCDCLWSRALSLQRNPFASLETLQSGTLGAWAGLFCLAHEQPSQHMRTTHGTRLSHS